MAGSTINFVAGSSSSSRHPQSTQERGGVTALAAGIYTTRYWFFYIYLMLCICSIVYWLLLLKLVIFLFEVPSSVNFFPFFLCICSIFYLMLYKYVLFVMCNMNTGRVCNGLLLPFFLCFICLWVYVYVYVFMWVKFHI